MPRGSATSAEFISERPTMLKIGDKLPAARLQEFVEAEGDACPRGPAPVDIATAAAGKVIAIFALPGAFTPTCSARHVPGYLAAAADLSSAAVDEIWCIAVNDAHVMGAWARDQKTAGAVRMLADGNAQFTKAAGLEVDLSAAGMGLRSQRYSMLAVDGVVRQLNVDAPGKFAVSDAQTLLAQARALATAA
jgi:peroxiredoxin